MCLTLHVCEWRLQVYSKDSSGKSVPKQLLPEAYKSATCRSVRTKRRCPRNVVSLLKRWFAKIGAGQTKGKCT